MAEPSAPFFRTIGTRLRRAPGARSPEAWSSATMYLVACGLLLFGAVDVPMGNSFAHPVDVGLAGGCALAAGITWFVGPHLGRLLPHAVVIFGIAVVTVAIAVSNTFGGETYPAFGYLWSAIYLAYFFSRRAVLAYVALIAASYGVALGIAQASSVLAAWIVVVVSVVTVALILNALVELLARQAERDPLTDALNRTGLEKWTAVLRTASERRGTPITLVAIDLDGFKDVNDRIGHVAADGLLVELVDRWRKQLRAGDLVGRIGGDEFVLVLQDTTPDKVSSRLADMRRASPLSWSAGVTALDTRESLETALTRADADLYRDKMRRPVRPTYNP